MEFEEFVESLYKAEKFTDAFAVYDREVKRLGFEAVLYTLIPRVIVDHSLKPVFAVSDDYCPEYLRHYEGGRFDRHDPLIKAVSSGESSPLDWYGPVVQRYNRSETSQEVFNTAFGYGIRNGLTLPLKSGFHGLSGASFISSDHRPSFLKLLRERQAQLKLRTELFHNLVVTSSSFSGQFAKPVVDSLNSTEKAYIVGLAAGKSNQQIAAELNRSVKYLEQVMLRVRRKFSGVGQDDTPLINRNQVLYYAGLLSYLE